MDRKCWIAGHEATGYLLYYAPTRGKAREMMASDFGIDFYDSLWADVRRVAGLDNLSDGVLDNYMAFLVSGMFGECSACHTEVAFSEGYLDPWWLKSVSFREYIGPYCYTCVEDRADGVNAALFLTKSDALKVLQEMYQVRSGDEQEVKS